jgi:hypothetical protein
MLPPYKLKTYGIIARWTLYACRGPAIASHIRKAGRTVCQQSDKIEARCELAADGKHQTKSQRSPMMPERTIARETAAPGWWL